MTSYELREKYLSFFKEKDHNIIPGSSLIPEHDPTVLFTTAGMHPLVPFLSGEKHAQGKRLADVQKCIRTDDIEEVGDSWHLTFFEMLGNWSLGDYWKKQAIEWSFEFLTGKKYLAIPLEKISVTVFAGDDDAPQDEESARIWQELGIPKQRIYYLPKKDNWWGPAGQTGPSGPCTEMFYDTGKKDCSFDCKPGCSCGKYSEIWNDVFMEYNKTEEGKYVPLEQKNVDTGMGVERTIAVLLGFDNVFETELFEPIIKEIKALSKKEDEKSLRIIADHIKAATFILAENVEPSNVEQGYVLRRLIRRSVRYAKQLGIEDIFCHRIAKAVIEIYKDVYPEVYNNQDFILEQLIREEEKFEKTLERGLKEFERLDEITGEKAFNLYQSYGFPLELTEELAKEKGIKINKQEFKKAFEHHQEVSRRGAEQKFKGGLADHSEKTTKYHTATHLLLAALRKVLGEHIYQKGSNITSERLRFDFSHKNKLTEQEVEKIEKLVNQAIKQDLEVKFEEMSLDEAKKQGAMGVFGEKYGAKVKVYTIGDFSKEICGGPHVKRTSELGTFKITKQESPGAGARRIRAVLE
ncbi:alanine--tRNA ligase [Parcubacteria bacterium DG_72]|nr:MAG: alanine--tRNA ligase [Parcubacteria bacterium DG_72]